MFENSGNWSKSTEYPIQIDNVFCSLRECETLDRWISDNVKSLEPIINALSEDMNFDREPFSDELIHKGEFKAYSSCSFLYHFFYYFECFSFFEKTTEQELLTKYATTLEYEHKSFEVDNNPFNPKFRQFFRFLDEADCLHSFLEPEFSSDDSLLILSGLQKAIKDTVESYSKLFGRTLNFDKSHFTFNNPLYCPVYDESTLPEWYGRIYCEHESEEVWYEEGWIPFADYPVPEEDFDSDRDCLAYWDPDEEYTYEEYIKDYCDWLPQDVLVSYEDMDASSEIQIDEILNYYSYGKFICGLLYKYVHSAEDKLLTLKQFSVVVDCCTFIQALPYIDDNYIIELLEKYSYWNDSEGTGVKEDLALLFHNQIIQIFKLLNRYSPYCKELPALVRGFCDGINEVRQKNLIYVRLAKDDCNVYLDYSDRYLILSNWESSTFIKYEQDSLMLDSFFSSFNLLNLEDILTVNKVKDLVDSNLRRAKLEKEDENRQAENFINKNKRIQLFSSYNIYPKIAIFIYENYEELSEYWEKAEQLYLDFQQKHGFKHYVKDNLEEDIQYVERCLKRISSIE